MPLPRDDTTPPVTKMYFVELTDSPPSVGGSPVFRRTAGRLPCRRRAPRARGTARHRSEDPAAAAAAARAAPTALPARGRAGPSDPALPGCRRRHPRADGKPPRSTTEPPPRHSGATTKPSHTPASKTRRTTQRMRGSPARDRRGLRGRRLEPRRAETPPRTGTGEHTKSVPWRLALRLID